MFENNGCVIGIKAKGEEKYYSRKEIYPNNIYDVLIRLDVAKLEMKRSAEVFFYCDYDLVGGGTVQVDIEVDEGDNTHSYYDSILLNSEIQTVMEIVKGTMEISGLRDCALLADTFEEQFRSIVYIEQLDGSGMIEFRFRMRSIPLTINMNIDGAGKEMVNDDFYLEVLRENGAGFHVEVVNKGDQIERGLFLYCIPPVGQEYITGSTDVGTGESGDEFFRDETDNICKEGIVIGDIMPGERTNVFFNLKLSGTTTSNERRALFLNSVYMRRGTARFWQSYTSILDLFDLKGLDVINKEESKPLPFTPERVCEYSNLVEGVDFGPERKTFKYDEEPDIYAFNAITDHPVFGDERQFILIRPVNSSEKFKVKTEVESGEIYEIMIFYHNINPNCTMQNSSMSVSFPRMIPAGQTEDIMSRISGNEAAPKEIWSKIRLYSRENVKIEVVNNVGVHYGRIHEDGKYIDLEGLEESYIERWFIDDGSPMGYLGIMTSNKPGYVLFRIRIRSMEEEDK